MRREPITKLSNFARQFAPLNVNRDTVGQSVRFIPIILIPFIESNGRLEGIGLLPFRWLLFSIIKVSLKS